MLSKSICDLFDRDYHFFVHLTKLRKIGTIRDYIAYFEQLAIKTDRVGDELYLECFISGLKEVIQAHFRMHHPTTWLEACNKALEVEVALNAQSNRPNFVARARLTLATGPTQTLKVQKVSTAVGQKKQTRALLLL